MQTYHFFIFLNNIACILVKFFHWIFTDFHACPLPTVFTWQAGTSKCVRSREFKHPYFPFWKLNIFLWFLYKSDSCISCFRNDGEMKVSKVHRTCHSINGGSLEITHLFHLSIITSYKKSFIKKALINTPFSVNIYLTSLFM